MRHYKRLNYLLCFFNKKSSILEIDERIYKGIKECPQKPENSPYAQSPKGARAPIQMNNAKHDLPSLSHKFYLGTRDNDE